MDIFKKTNEAPSFAVIIAKYNHQFVLVKHKKRDTFEFPGGKRTPNESILECAKRELFEETGAVDFMIEPLTTYAFKNSCGMLYKGVIYKFGELPESEIEKVVFLDEFPNNWTYPEIQPYLINFYLNG